MNILEEANSIVSVDRQQAYGPPERNLNRIARLWSLYLEHEVSSRDVSMMMVLLKIARDMHAAKRDNLVDIAGYARLAEIAADAETRAAQAEAQADAASPSSSNQSQAASNGEYSLKDNQRFLTHPAKQIGPGS